MGHSFPASQAAQGATPQTRPSKRKPLAVLLSHAIFSGALASLALQVGSASASDSSTTRSAVRKDYDIPAGPLAATLKRFSAEAGITLVVGEELANNKQSKELRGNYSVTEAFASLLASTGLNAVAQGKDQYTLRQQTSLNTEPTLPVMTVTGSPPRLYATPDVNAGALGVRETQDLPFSIGSYKTDVIENQRARTALDVLKNDPSVTPVTYAASFDGVAVRGFSANTFNNVRRDGLLANVYADVPLENKERVDVLKGVSGFLYGVGDPSGLVNYVIKRPTRNPLLSITTEARTQNGYYANIDAGGPIGSEKQVGYRVNAAYEKVGDFTHPGDIDRKFVSGALDVKVNADALLQLDFDYQQKTQSANAGLPSRIDGSLVPAKSVDPRTLIGQPWGRYKSTSWNLGARLDYALNDAWLLTSQLGYGSTKRNAQFNNIYQIDMNGDVLDGDISYEGEDYTVGSAQLFATGQFKTGSLSHQVVPGYSYSKMTYPEGPYLSLPNSISNIYKPDPVANPGFPSDTNLPQAYATQHSVFISDTLGLSEHWSVLLGGRYISYLNDKPRDYPDSGVHLRYRTSQTVPTLSVLFKPASHTTLYTTYTKGFEQGAYAPSWADNAYERLDPITSTQYELGVKSQVTKGLMLASALFDIDKPLQAVSAVDNVFKTKGRQHHRGIELTANGELTQRLSSMLGLAWLDAKQLATDDPNVDGKRPANVAKFQANAFLDYRLPFLEGLSLNGGYYYLSKRPLDGSNSVMVDSFGRWDIGAAYKFGWAKNASVVRLTVQNLSNKRYWESVVYGTVGMAQARIVRLSLTSNF